jgi:hypothetical protein
MAVDERQLYGDYSPHLCDGVARWWMRQDGCCAVEAGLLRPRYIRSGILGLAESQGARCWYRTGTMRLEQTTGREWVPLDETSDWHRQIEIFTGYIEGMGSGEGELLVCRANLNPNIALAFRRALVMFDTGTVSDVLLWAEQPETDPCAWAFVARSWVEPIRVLLRMIAQKEVIKDYKRLRSYMRFSAKIDYVIRGAWES